MWTTRLLLSPSSAGLNQVVTLASPGVVADSNGFFHPIGDHAQTQFSIDNQPITDQQSRLYSNQISPDAVQSMEVITGVAPAEYGDKSSLVVHIVTRSGLDQPRPSGSASVGYGSFQAPTAAFNLGVGSSTVGNFVSMSGLRSDRFLDPPHCFVDVFAGIERADAEVALAAEAEAAAGGDDDVGFFEHEVEGVPAGDAAGRFDPDVRRVHAAEDLEAR